MKCQTPNCGNNAGPTGLCGSCFLGRDSRAGSLTRPADEPSAEELAAVVKKLGRRKPTNGRLVGIPVGDFFAMEQRTIYVVGDGSGWWLSNLRKTQLKPLMVE